MLIEDLETGGPIFGKFVRSLGDAAISSVLSAEQQGEDLEVMRFLDRVSGEDYDDLLEAAYAEDLFDVSDVDIPLMWVAELVNTCEQCLPLHGKIATEAEWLEMGFHPDTIHKGWRSSCHCTLLPVEMLDAAQKKELAAPLARIRQTDETGKISRRTVRSVAQQSLEKSIAAMEKAQNSEVGRRTLRQMGKANAE
jgi:hypothetical protein